MRRLGALVLVLATVAAVPVATAGAHAMPTSAVELDVGAHDVRAQVELPLDRLAVALQRDELTAAQATGPQRASLQRYVARHVTAVGEDGTTWATSTGTATVRTIDGHQDLVVPVTLAPPGGDVTSFDLRYDAIIDQLVTHKAIATIRSQFDKGTTARDPETLGVFDWTTRDLHVDADGGSWLRGFVATAGLGVQHIATGADHLLFLLMLLLPAPLVARRGRWRRGDDAKRSAVRVVHVVTAFAVGHSITLALAALGLVHPPTRVVESLIAVSILVSAVHAVRPLVPRGEPLIAGLFGLVHGLAFATLLGELGLHGGALVVSLLGFNLGIELTQLLVVALMMPSLYALSRTPLYPALRLAAAGFGIVLATAWLLERTTIVGHDPFAGVSDWAIGHPLVISGALALVALIASAPASPASRPSAPAAAAARR